MKLNKTVKKVIVWRILSFTVCAILAYPFFNSFVSFIINSFSGIPISLAFDFKKLRSSEYIHARNSRLSGSRWFGIAFVDFGHGRHGGASPNSLQVQK